MNRILNITHNDLDGLAAGVAIRIAHTGEHVRTLPTGNGLMASTLLKELTSKRRKYDRIILSDCSIKIPGARCNRESDYFKSKDREIIAQFGDIDDDHVWLSEHDVINHILPDLIRQYVSSGGEFVVLDHHPTAIPMSEYYHDVLHELSILEVKDNNGIARAGSELAGRYYHTVKAKYLNGHDDICLTNLMMVTGDYDVFRDPTGIGAKLAIAQELMDDSHTFMNELLNILEDYWEGSTLEQAIKNNPLMGEFIKLAEKELQVAIQDAKRNITVHTDKVCSVNLNKYPSLVSHSIYTDTHGIVVITYSDNPKKLSFRSHPSGGVNLGEFVAKFGGGGHELAAGLTIPPGETFESIVSELVRHAG